MANKPGSNKEGENGESRMSRKTLGLIGVILIIVAVLGGISAAAFTSVNHTTDRVRISVISKTDTTGHPGGTVKADVFMSDDGKPEPFAVSDRSVYDCLKEGGTYLVLVEDWLFIPTALQRTITKVESEGVMTPQGVESSTSTC